MSFRRFLLGGVVMPLLCVGLVACQTKPNSSQGPQYAPGSAADDASYPLYAGEGYRGTVRRDSHGRIINSPSAPSDQTYYFAFDASTVSAADRQFIEVQAKYLALHPHAKLRLEGNTDNMGSREYNVGLGWKRDQGVAAVLEAFGAQSKQINMVSYGKERPARLGNSADARMLNRRVHLVYEEKR